MLLDFLGGTCSECLYKTNSDKKKLVKVSAKRSQGLVVVLFRA